MFQPTGSEAFYGVTAPGLGVRVVPVSVAEVFADAHRRLTGQAAVAHLGDGEFVHGGSLRAPQRWGQPTAEAIETLMAARNPAVLVGPGVVEADAVGDLRAFAVAGSLGVLNTWGAKGVFDWRSRHHLATVGLQARDFELGGLAEADLIVAVGLDQCELQADWQLAPMLTVEPGWLGTLSETWSRPRCEIAIPSIRAGLAEVTQRGWSRASAPLPPSRITRHYSTLLGGGGLVAADPGTAGYWVARTLGTVGLRAVLVPSQRSAAGFAVACAAVARLRDPKRPVLAVVDRLDEPTGLALEVAAAWGIEMPVEVWDADGDRLDAQGHAERLGSLIERGGVVTVAYDSQQFAEMEAVAGPVVAWTR